MECFENILCPKSFWKKLIKKLVGSIDYYAGISLHEVFSILYTVVNIIWMWNIIYDYNIYRQFCFKLGVCLLTRNESKKQKRDENDKTKQGTKRTNYKKEERET